MVFRLPGRTVLCCCCEVTNEKLCASFLCCPNNKVSGIFCCDGLCPCREKPIKKGKHRFPFGLFSYSQFRNNGTVSRNILFDQVIQ